MRRSNTPTLQDVAREVGVSAMTVSVVLNGSRSATRVSDATRHRIKAAADRLQYRPNAVARGLSRRCMDTIGVVSEFGSGLNLYFLEILNGILEGASEHGQNATVFSLKNWEAGERQRILECCDGRVDGMIFIAPTRLTTEFTEAIQRRSPFVTIHGNGTGPDVFNIDVDNEGGSYVVTRHLIEQKHQRIAHLTGDMEFRGPQERIAGYRRALTESGIIPDPALIIPASFSAVSGRREMDKFLAEGAWDGLPTAVVCASDDIATGCIESLTAHGLRVPEDISVTGFDDSLTARLSTPALTTARQPFHRIGQRAVELLLSQIARPGVTDSSLDSPLSLEAAPDALLSIHRPEGAHTEVFPAELVVRASTGPPPTAPISVSSLSQR